ncbi:hypothetical protein GCM10011574_07300 [Microbispora bryophytorum]|uniref:Uncharacterized protein n=1 Tax=Microbispora bryophytorum TaxID=1460882 RepID=A0A8H9GUE1_9ACTN|nr:hypothetical protein GCM10011574_07300 [Microbispora bryophytorum]
MTPHRITRWAHIRTREARLAITYGIDWTEKHHDIALVRAGATFEGGKLVE